MPAPACPASPQVDNLIQAMLLAAEALAADKQHVAAGQVRLASSLLGAGLFMCLLAPEDVPRLKRLISVVQYGQERRKPV